MPEVPAVKPVHDDRLEGILAERAAMAAAAKVTPDALGVRAYLEQTVVPLLLEGMTQLTNDRCAFCGRGSKRGDRF